MTRHWLSLPIALSLAACATEAPVSQEEPAGFAFDDSRLTSADKRFEFPLAAGKSRIDAVIEAVGLSESLVVKEEVDELGMTHVRVRQTIGGVPVMGGDAIVHFDEAGRMVSITGRIVPDVALDATTTITAEQAREALRSVLAKRRLDFAVMARGEEDLPLPELLVVPTREGDVLAWHSRALLESDDMEPQELETLVDAKTGALLQMVNVLETAKPGSGGGTPTGSANGTGNTQYSGSVSITTATWSTGDYRLYDIGRNARTTDMNNRQSGTGALFADSDNVWGNGTSGDRATAGTDAHYGAQKTMDYYAAKGRNGIDGAGNTTLPYGYTFSRVHYGRNYVNAFWSDSCGCMTYGDGNGTSYTALTSLDVAGHEMTHGVTSRTAGLTYSGESGGLNESISDIFGTAVEFYAANANDPGDYLIGEEIVHTSRGWLRNMANPSADGLSIDHYSQYYSGLDVHYSSGLANILHYLLSEGGTHPTSGANVTGIGRAKSEAIFYRALTVYMTSGTNFAGARTAMISAASDLYGAGSAEASAVAAAWSACGVN